MEGFLEQDTECTKHEKLHTFKYINIKITFNTHYEKKEKTSHRQENIFAVHVANNTFVPRIYKEPQHFSLESNSAIFDKVEDIHIQKLSNSIVVGSSREPLRRETWLRVFCAVLFVMVKNWRHPKKMDK